MTAKEIRNKEKQVIDLLIKNIKNLQGAIDNPNYQDGPGTKNALNKYKAKLDVLKKSPKFKEYIELNLVA